MRYVIAITLTGVQYRVNLPKALIKQMRLDGERYLIIEYQGGEKAEIRRMYDKTSRQDK